MRKVINAIGLAMDSRIFLSELRFYLREGFPEDYVKERYLWYFRDPGISEADWLIVRDSILPIVRDLDCKFGEFGPINWEDV